MTFRFSGQDYELGPITLGQAEKCGDELISLAQGVEALATTGKLSELARQARVVLTVVGLAEDVLSVLPPMAAVKAALALAIEALAVPKD